MKRILVPTDFSNTSGSALQFAGEIAVRTKGNIYLLNVIEFPKLNSALPVPVQAYEQVFIKELKQKANSVLEKFKSVWGKQLKIHFSMEHGSIASVVQKFVAKKKIDLVVMGTHGSSGLEEYFIGSNTEKIVQTSKVPVIAIKKFVPVDSLRHIVFPTNLSFNQDTLVVRVKELQAFMKAKLHVLFVNTPANFKRDVILIEKLKEFGKRYQLRNYSLNIYNDIDEENGIINFSTQFKNSLIAMSTHGRKGLNHLFTGSVAEDVVNHIKGPVWTLSTR